MRRDPSVLGVVGDLLVNLDFFTVHQTEGTRAAHCCPTHQTPYLPTLSLSHSICIRDTNGGLVACEQQSIETPHFYVLQDFSLLEFSLSQMNADILM